jgi:glycosyltransferase involved in cell wall biosynthesis
MINHSFAVMAYKDSPYLSDCLNSLKSQTIESIIYISTSTPSTYINEIANKFGIEVFISEAGQGIAHDWNFSLQLGKTKYITLAHQDDIYLSGYTDACLRSAERYKDTLICFTDYSEIVAGDDRFDTLLLNVKNSILWCSMPFKKNLKRNFWKKRLISMGSPIAAPSVMYNIEKLTGFTFSNAFNVNMDWDAWYRMSEMEGRFVYVNKVLMKHRIHIDSTTTKGLEANVRQNEDSRMFKRLWPEFIACRLARLYSKSYHSNTDLKA